MEGLDIGTLYWFETRHQTWLTPIMIGLTRIGDAPTVIAVLGLVLAAYFLIGWRWAAVVLLASALTGLTVAYTIKEVVKRQRPDVAWELVAKPSTHSFPSGHSCNSMSSYFAAALLTARRLRRRWLQGLLVAGVFLLCIGIGTSRMYLGVHWFTDVLAGWSLGLTCALMACWADRRWVSTAPPPIDPAERPFLV